VNKDDEVSVKLSKQGLLAAAQALVGARGGVFATEQEKRRAAEHLLRHFNESEITPPESLTKMLENVQFMNSLYENEKITIGFDSEFISKIAKHEEEDYFASKFSMNKNDIFKIVDTIGNIITPFVSESVYIELDESQFLNCCKIINKCAVNIGQVINDEYVESNENAELYSMAASEISTLKSNLTSLQNEYNKLYREYEKTQDSIKKLEQEKQEIEERMYETARTLKSFQDAQELNNTKYKIIYKYKESIDEDTYNEIITADSQEKLQMINKWLVKMTSKNKLNINDIFTASDTDIESQKTVVSDSVTNVSGVFNTKNEKNEKKDKIITDIIKLIKSK